MPPRLLNFDRFHQSCLLPGRIPGQVKTVIPVPCGDHLPLRTALSSLLASHWRYLPRRLDGTTAGRCVCRTPITRVIAHTQVRTLVGPPPPVETLPWEPHPSGYPKHTWSRHDVGSSRSTRFINFFRMGAVLCFLPAISMSSTHTDKNNPCFR